MYVVKMKLVQKLNITNEMTTENQIIKFQILTSRGKPFPTWMFREEEAIYVDKVPDFIDGQTLYKVHTTHTTWQQTNI